MQANKGGRPSREIIDWRDTGLLTRVTASRELHQAYQQVEGNQLEDHPKQAALRRILGGIEALAPVRDGQDRRESFYFAMIMFHGLPAC